MSKRQKLIERFLVIPNDFTYDELVQVLKLFGYMEDKSGKHLALRLDLSGKTAFHKYVFINRIRKR